MVSKTLKLNNGMVLPTIGLGTYQSKPGEVETAVKIAIDAGYRHFDCAWFYGNEGEVGTAIREKIASGDVKREELFITSKLWNNFHAKDKVVEMLKESLKASGLDYLDLFLIHWPFAFKEDAKVVCLETEHPLLIPRKNYQDDGESAWSDIDYLETWLGMEEAQNLGLTKAIGVSNFNSEQISRILENCTIKPVVNQVEVNPNLNQKKLINFCKQRGIVVVGYCPLGRTGNMKPGFPEPTVLDPKVIEIAKKYNKSPAQVVLNYLVSLGIGIIPKSITESRIKENLNIFDFSLNSEETAYLDSCNKNERVCPLLPFKKHKYFSFNTEF